MQRWRRRIFYLLVVYSAAMILWAARPWTDTQALVTPPDVPLAFAEYQCPSVFSSGTADLEPSAETPYPPAKRPCGEQDRHRVLFVLDMAAAGAGMVLLQRSSARYRAASAAADAREAELAEPS